MNQSGRLDRLAIQLHRSGYLWENAAEPAAGLGSGPIVLGVADDVWRTVNSTYRPGIATSTSWTSVR